ncbi:MarC family protein [Compostibacter hankyongensis]|uniref:UPF0056 membrane protein n=1 Tax=Compostibacter hankyongensis TaxID=1007089 RepID=A0ABP8FTQ8_9BACT
MFSLKQIFTVTFTLLAVIDIIGSIPVLLSLKEKMGGIHPERATLASGFLMVLFFFGGEQLLSVLGVEIHSFAVAGSIVIFIIGLEMILGLEIFKNDPAAGKSGSYVPVAFPIIAGSGTLTTIISLKADFGYYNILAGILVNLVLIYVVLRSLNWLERRLGKSGLMVIRKFFGVILLAIAIRIFKSNLGV